MAGERKEIAESDAICHGWRVTVKGNLDLFSSTGARCMRAALMREVGQSFALENVILRPAEAEEVRIKMVACSICQSDLSFLQGQWSCDLPALLGHEAAGIVIEAGPQAGGFKPGDRVIASLIRSCGACPACLGGLAVNCSAPPEMTSPVITTVQGETVWQGMNMGAFAEEILVHHHQVMAVPDALPLNRACLLSCGVITGWGSVRHVAGLAKGAKTAVIGIGGIGLNILQAARMAGASAQLGLDISAAKQSAAHDFGASHFADPRDADAVQAALRDMRAEAGLDAVFVSVGLAAAIEQAIGLVKPGGMVIIAGMPASDDPVQLDAASLAAASKIIKGSKMGAAILQQDIPQLVSFWQDDKLDLDALVSHHFPFDEINQAISTATQGGARRVVIEFGEA